MATLQEIGAVLSGFPRNLTWGSFPRVPRSREPPRQASISSSYRMGTWRTVVERGSYRVRGFRITVSVNAAGTWATPGAVTDMALLIHEQGHYDITGLIARDLARNLLDLELSTEVVAAMRESGTTAAQHTRYVQQQFQRSVDEEGRKAATLLAKLQTNPITRADGIYDVQTNHGLRRAEQDAWNARLTRVRQRNDDFGFALALAGVV